jgi:TonB family protein
MADLLAASPFAHAVGLALVHFLWQGAVLGAAAAFVLASARRASAATRYVVGCVTLAAMTAVVAITFAQYARAFLAGAAETAAWPAVITSAMSTASTPVRQAAEVQTFVFALGWLEARWPIAVLLWLSGVAVLSMHLLRAWLLVHRIRRTGTTTTGAWQTRVETLARRLRISRTLRLLESAWIDVPSVIGWIRPIIVLPASTLAGLSPEQFDAILAHELAHVRRHDYLINALQSALEVLLFYHPAVWWVSHQVRIEREHCCDDLAVEISGDRVAYARALACLEERRAAPALAMGARSGDLLTRVRRLVRATPAAAGSRSAWAAVAATTALAAIAVGTYFSRPVLARSDMPSPPVTAAAAARLESSATMPAPPAAPARLARTPRVAPAQVRSATINVQVVDQQGGTLPGAAITFASGLIQASALTNAAGRATISSVPAGTYDITISLAGFRTRQYRLDVGPDGLNVRFRLDVGSMTETLTVMSPTPLATPTQTPDPNVAAAARDAVAADLLAHQQVDAKLGAEDENKPTVVDFFDQSGPVRVGGDIKEPRKIHDQKPAYPEEALAAGVQGVVIIEAVIARDGTVQNARVLRSIPMLDQAALDAVLQWKFTPTLLNGVPVEVIMTVTVNFTGR